jgi:nucleoside 2-deoxyribosyltransferase
MYHVYLAGPITGLSFDKAVNWREEFIKRLPPEIIGLSPLRAKDYLEGEPEIAACYENAGRVLSTERGISARDFFDVKRSDLIVVNMHGADKASIGTAMEIAAARVLQIPVIMVMEPKGNPNDHPMIRDSVGWRVANIEEALWLTKVILMPAPHRKPDVLGIRADLQRYKDEFEGSPVGGEK